MTEAMKVLDDRVDRVVEANNGLTVKPRGEGDSHFLVFSTALDGVKAVAELQRVLGSTDWPTERPLEVRAALHTGSADLRSGDYYGPTVNRAARLRAIAHGGQTILSAATRELVADSLPHDLTLSDLGEHRLRDLSRPERVYQLNADGLPDTFPPLSSLRDIPNNLPDQPTDFVGRDVELRRTKEILRETRLLTILAPGGAGKTRLAIQAAADMSEQFPDGVYLIRLADIRSSDEIIQSTAEALGLGLSADVDVQVQLLNYLATKRQLLIFDNFEHVRDGAAILSSILDKAPDVTLVVTSRAKLGLSAETVMTLSGLEIDWADPDEARSTEGVQLFVDSARQVNPEFSLEEADLEPLGQILRLTDGMPLAIILAAAWADMLSVAEIATEVSKNLDFLEADMGDVPDRHQSVRAAFEYSWALLEKPEQDTFARLAVFRGGFTREAAEQVADATLRNLANLVSKALLTADPTSGRYAVHELLRQFAEAQLESDPELHDRILDAHAGYYASLMEDTTALLFESDQIRMAHLVEMDIGNIRVAWRRLIQNRDGRRGAALVPSLYFVYEWRGWYQSAVTLFGEAVDGLDPDSDDDDVLRLRALAMAVQGWFMSLRGQPERGVSASVEGKESLPVTASLLDRWIARQCVAIGRAYTGAVDEMAQVTEEGIELTSQLEDQFYVAGLRNWRAFAAHLGGDADTAKGLLPSAMEVFEARDEHYYMTWNLWLQAWVARSEERPHDAIDLYTRQVARSAQLGYLRGKVVALEGLGDANVAAELLSDAERAYAQSLATADQMGMAPDMLGLMVKIARIRAELGRDEDGVELLAAVSAEPLSRRQTFTSNVPIRTSASQALDEIRDRLDESDYERAHRRGLERKWDEAAKMVMEEVGAGQPV